MGRMQSLLGLLLSVCGLVLPHATTASAQEVRESDPAFVLEKGRAGNLRVGAQADDVIALFGRDNTRLVNLNHEGMFTPALEVRPQGGDGPIALIAEIGGGPCIGYMVSGIHVLDRRYRTKEGVGVGSTVGDAGEHYALQYTREEGAKLLAEPVSMIFFSSGDLQDAATVLDRIFVRLPWPEFQELCATRRR